jgi:Mn-containing catalase
LDGGDGDASVDGLTEAQQDALDALAARTASDPDADPLTGAELGAGRARGEEPADALPG